MDNEREYLSLNYLRRYGAELELNAADMRSRPLGWERDDKKLPEGIHYVAHLVKKITGEIALVHKYGTDHHNNTWIVKPDSSCGIEVCTPVLKGWNGLKRACLVADGFRQDYTVSADQRCSCHVHVEIADLTETQLASVLTWWLKCEPVFMDMVPSRRKRSQYCQLLGETEMFDDIEDGFYEPRSLFMKLGQWKYYSINTFHLMNRKRATIEFRIMDNLCSINPWTLKNWVRLVLHFVERAVSRGMPVNYEEGNKWSGYCWLDPIDVFEFLGFLPGEYVLSPGLQQVRGWMFERLLKEGYHSGFRSGVMCDKAREVAKSQVSDLGGVLGYSEVEPGDEEIYGEQFRV